MILPAQPLSPRRIEMVPEVHIYLLREIFAPTSRRP